MQTRGDINEDQNNN